MERSVRKAMGILLSLLWFSGFSQQNVGIEHYYYTHGAGQLTLVPRAWYQSRKNTYAEMRFNYEEDRTFSVHAGKTFLWERKLSFAVTPLAGLLLGRATGASLGAKAELCSPSFYVSAEPQYVFTTRGNTSDFFYNWAEVGYQPADFLALGLAMQHTRLHHSISSFESGVMLGFNYRNVAVPVYGFNLLNSKRYFVLGIQWQLHP